MNKYKIKFNGSWDYSGIDWTYMRDLVTYYDENGDVTTDTALAVEYSITEGTTTILNGFFGTNYDYGSTPVSCDKLVSIEIPDTITSLGADNSLNPPNWSTNFGVVCNCYNLTEVKIPNSVVNLYASALSNNYSLTKIVLPNSLTKLEYGVLDNNQNLREVTICDSITEIDRELMINCPSLEKIYVEPASSLDNMKTIMSVHNSGLVDLMVGALPTKIKSAQPKLNNGEDISYITTAETVYVSDITNEGKNKILQTKLDEIDSAIVGKTNKVTTDALSTRVDGLEGELDTKVMSVTSTDDAIEVGGTATAPTIGLKIDDTASAGNVMLEVTAEGLKASTNITQFQTIVVDALPAEGSSLYYYLVKTATEDLYNEYVWSEVSTGVFEFVFLGDTSVDLANYVTNEELTAALALKANTTEVNDALALKANKATTDTLSARIDGVDAEIATKQDTLVSGVGGNIKTINGETLLGSGDLEIGGAVDSVNGQTGVVVLDAEDVGTYNKTEIDDKVSGYTKILLNLGEVEITL